MGKIKTWFQTRKEKHGQKAVDEEFDSNMKELEYRRKLEKLDKDRADFFAEMEKTKKENEDKKKKDSESEKKG